MNVWPEQETPLGGVFEEARRSPCLRVLNFGPEGATEDDTDPQAFTLAEWERLECERPELFEAPPDPEGRFTVLIRYVKSEEAD